MSEVLLALSAVGKPLRILLRSAISYHLLIPSAVSMTCICYKLIQHPWAPLLAQLRISITHRFPANSWWLELVETVFGMQDIEILTNIAMEATWCIQRDHTRSIHYVRSMLIT